MTRTILFLFAIVASIASFLPTASAGTTCVTDPRASACLCVEIEGCGPWAYACEYTIRFWSSVWGGFGFVCKEMTEVRCAGDEAWLICTPIGYGREVVNRYVA